jgi:hypothetical protein
MKFRMRSGIIIITLPVIDPARPSKSGKTLLVATSRGGRRTSLRSHGRPVFVNANVYVRPAEQPDKKKPRISKTQPLHKRAKKR